MRVARVTKAEAEEFVVVKEAWATELLLKIRNN
jgi:hypothetical protein